VRRLFWLATGLGAGATGTILVSRWLRRQADRLAPPNLARQAGRVLTAAGADLADTLAGAVEAFREGMAEREAELRASDSGD
jgi:hypothetical protein